VRGDLCLGDLLFDLRRAPSFGGASRRREGVKGESMGSDCREGVKGESKGATSKCSASTQCSAMPRGVTGAGIGGSTWPRPGTLRLGDNLDPATLRCTGALHSSGDHFAVASALGDLGGVMLFLAANDGRTEMDAAAAPPSGTVFLAGEGAFDVAVRELRAM